MALDASFFARLRHLAEQHSSRCPVTPLMRRTKLGPAVGLHEPSGSGENRTPYDDVGSFTGCCAPWRDGPIWRGDGAPRPFGVYSLSQGAVPWITMDLRRAGRDRTPVCRVGAGRPFLWTTSPSCCSGGRAGGLRLLPGCWTALLACSPYGLCPVWAGVGATS